jgi:hypothetical protein
VLRDVNELRDFVHCMKLQKMPADEDVVVEGDLGYNYYFILSGDVNIYVPIDKNSKAYREKRGQLKELEDKLELVLENKEKHESPNTSARAGLAR